MADRTSLRLAATLLLIGFVVFTIAQVIHQTIDGQVKSNDDVAEFTAIAAGSNWIAVHLAQFLGIAVLTAGLLALYYGLNLTAGLPLWVNRYGAVAAVVSLALNGVIYIVDGVALKQAADAWVSAPQAEKAARFASAETIRWLEWGSRSYSGIMFGLALMLIAIAIVWSARMSRPLGYIIAVNGLASIVLGWQTGAQGFASSGALAFYAFSLTFLVWMVWFVVVAWRMKESVPAAPA